MPAQYTAMRDKFMNQGMSKDKAQAKAAAIYNSKHPHNPVTGHSDPPPRRKKTMAKGKLGSGSRFKKLKRKLSHRKGVHDPGALAAFIGRKKYGKKKMAKMAAKGRKKS